MLQRVAVLLFHRGHLYCRGNVLTQGFDGNILKLASPASYSTDASSSGKRKEIDSLGQIVGVVESLRYVEKKEEN